MSLKPIRLGFEMLEPRHLLNGAASAAATVSVEVPDDLTGEPSGHVIAPVNIDDAEGVRGAEIEIHYDTTLLDADSDSVVAGSVWPEGAEVVVNVDDSTGTIVAWVYTAEGLDSGGGSLLEVAFTISSDAVVGESTEVNLVDVRLNEGEILPDPEPQEGSDETDGLITFVSDEHTASVSGYVYADTDNDEKPGEHEGVPGVEIVLISTDTGEQWETVTEDDGSYAFDELAAGSYTIDQRQPAAFLDGGENEIAVELSVGESLPDQNFRELGLRPEYVFNRLFTTTVQPVGSDRWTSTIREIVTDAGTDSQDGQTLSVLATTGDSSEDTSSGTRTDADAASEELKPVAVEQAVAGDDADSTDTETAASDSEGLVAYTAADTSEEPDEGVSSSVKAAAATVSVEVPDDLTGEPSGQVVAPVNIDDAEGVRGAEIEIHYDTTLLDADDESVVAGSVWPESGTEVVVNVDDSAGTIVAWVYTAEGLGSGGGSLLEVLFTISSDAVVGESTEVDLVEVRLNEGEIVLDPEPQAGSDGTDGLITFVTDEHTASVSGYVYADTDNDGEPGEHEGVPGVEIVLISTDTGEQWETVTEDDGSYAFDALAAGSYTIDQQQPAAFLDGGENEIAVELSAGESLSDQNFRELGLRPAYVFNRLFTTVAQPVGSESWTSAIRKIVDLAFETADSWLLDS